MRFTKEQKFILFAVGACNAKFSRRYQGKPIDVTLSKVAFIDLARKAKMVRTKPRSLYRNLENLEKQKYLSYNNKSLRLTKKGTAAYVRFRAELDPCMKVVSILDSKDVLRMTRKAKTVLKS